MKLKTTLAGVALALGLVLVPSVKADAATLTQVNPAQNSITVQWDAEPDALSYNVYVGGEYDEGIFYLSLPATQTSLTIKDLPAGCLKKVELECVKSFHDGEETYEESLDYGTFKTLPGKITNVAQKEWFHYAKSFNVEWDEVESADGYEYIIKTSKGKLVSQSTTTDHYTYQSKVSNNKVYVVQVRAYTEINGQVYYGAWSDKSYCFTQPMLKSLKKSGKKITVKWNKVDGATNYDIYVSTKPKTGYKKVKTVKANKNSYTIKKLNGKKLSSKKKYYVYVATVKKVGNRRYDSGKLYYWDTKHGATYDNYF